jgi:hypothetical protein
VLYELITGYQPHVAKNLVELLELKRGAVIVPPSQRRPEGGIPRALDLLLAEMLSADPAKRPQSAAALCERLEAVLAAKPVVTPVVPTPSKVRRALAHSLVAGMSVLVLGVGGAALAKTPAGEKAQASIKSAYQHVVKLRADALAHRAPPAPAPRAVVAVGSAPEAIAEAAEPVAAPAAPPVPLEANAAALDLDKDDEGEVDEQDAPAAAPPSNVASADQVDLTNEPEVEVKGVAQNDSVSQSEPAALADSGVISQTDALWEKGAKLRALALLKRASKKTPNDASVQKALVARAEQMAEWGEAVKAARRWASLDPSSEARLSLARLERATGHKERALALIDGVIKEEPSSPDAKTLLAEIRGQKLALSQ